MAKEQKNENELKQAIINLSLETIRYVSDLDSSDVEYGDKLIGIAKQMCEKSGGIVGTFSEAGETNGKTQDYQMVDLGLPSGLKWADRNVGAENIQDYGDYFMLGSTTPDTNKPCDCAHAPFNDGQEEIDDGYFNAHKSEWLTDEGVLKPEYDAAHAIMGGSWRMPTKDEMHELLDETTQSVETLGGAEGMRFTAPNGNSIFIPFAGYRLGSDVNLVGSYGYAWSSSLSTGLANLSHYLLFSNGVSAYVYGNFSYIGFVVRGVHE